jgi:UDP-3-O-[3-hydroxymyristoyl] glucosamine N-acyltransferase
LHPAGLFFTLGSMKVAFSPDEIVAIVKPRQVRGSTTETIRGLGSLGTAVPGDLSFLGNSKYRSEVPTTRASAVLVPADYHGEPGPNQLLLLVDNPSIAFARLCSRLEQALWPRPAAGVHPSAFVAPGALVAPSATIGPLCVVEAEAVIGEGSHLQAQVFVGRGARIGADCWLMPGVIVAAECVLKNRVRLQPGVVVGSDGFGYEYSQGRHEKVPQVGTVTIEDDVEIGANTTLDRARFSSTIVGEGTKIDNLVQVAHNVVIGKHCLICAQTGISGSTTLEDYVVLGGQAGIIGHVTLGKGAKVGAQTGVSGDLKPGAAVWGTPSRPHMFELRMQALRDRLPELFKRVSVLEKRVGGGEPGSGE